MAPSRRTAALLLSSALAASSLRPSAAAMPAWSYERVQSWAFPGCCHGCTSPWQGCVYAPQDYAHYAQFDVVLFQNNNLSQYANGSWVGNDESWSQIAGEGIKAAGGAAKPAMPYIQWSMPQAWYHKQARFNDPEPRWQKMWLRDSAGAYVNVLGTPGVHGLDEGADYTQYQYRRAYDWREPSTTEYFISEVLDFVLESPHLDGAFFDDVDFISALCVPGWYGSCGTYANGSAHAATPATCCGNWSTAVRELNTAQPSTALFTVSGPRFVHSAAARGIVWSSLPPMLCACTRWQDAGALLNATTATVVRVLEAFSAKGKTAVLSIQQDGWMSKETRQFHAQVMPAVRAHG